jgi:phage-related minor tail protein
MEEGIKIRIGADVSGLDKGVNQATQSLNKLKQPTAGAATTLQSLSRIAQDAPFGFIAIQNNIDPLIQSFQQLKAQSGSTGAALKSLFASLAGPAGIALAFSAVTSIITSLIQKYGSLANALSELGASQDTAAVRQRALNKAMDDSVASTEGEVQTLQNLVRALISTDTPQKNRVAAYETLKKEYPGVIQNMTQENALTAQGAKLIAQRSLQLIEYIKLKGQEAALIKLIETESKKQFEVQRAGLELVKNQGTVTNFLINSLLGAGNATVGLVGRQKSLTSEYEKAGQGVQFYSSELEKLQNQILGIDTKVSGITRVAGPKKGAAAVPVQLVPDPAQVASDPEAEILRAFNIQNGIEIPVNITVPQKAFKSLSDFGAKMKNFLDIDITKAKVAEFKQLLSQGLAQPLGDLIFNFLDKGKASFKDFADAAISSIKRIVAQLIATKIIQLIGSAIGGTAGGAAGGILGKALFGGAAAPDFSGLGTAGLGLTGQVVFVQRGTDLVGVMNNSNAQIRRVG